MFAITARKAVMRRTDVGSCIQSSIPSSSRTKNDKNAMIAAQQDSKKMVPFAAWTKVSARHGVLMCETKSGVCRSSDSVLMATCPPVLIISF